MCADPGVDSRENYFRPFQGHCTLRKYEGHIDAPKWPYQLQFPQRKAGVPMLLQNIPTRPYLEKPFFENNFAATCNWYVSLSEELGAYADAMQVV
jgi:hypothetical protein